MKNNRIEVIDALRGFAIATLMLLHATQHFLYSVFPENSPPWLSSANEAVRSMLVFLFSGKSYLIFALLFGFTFSLMYRKQRQNGKDFVGRFIWRQLLLLCFGLINVAFFPGDVLVSYAIAGLILIPFRHLSNKVILITALVLALLPGEIYMMIRSIADPGYIPFDNGYVLNYAHIKDGIATGSWSTTWSSNLKYAMPAGLGWLWDVGRVAQTASLFMAGFVVGKTNLFAENDATKKFWIKLAIGAFAAILILYPTSMSLKSIFESAPWAEPLHTIITSWYDIAFTAIIVSLFVLLYNYETFRKLCIPLSTYGKASLSNYIGQSVIGAILFYPCGLNLAPYTGMITSAIIAVFIILLQIQFTSFYLKTHRRGILEEIWHRLTWLTFK